MVIYHTEVPIVVASITLFPQVWRKVLRSLVAKVECLLNVVIRCQKICDMNMPRQDRRRLIIFLVLGAKLFSHRIDVRVLGRMRITPANRSRQQEEGGRAHLQIDVEQLIGVQKRSSDKRDTFLQEDEKKKKKKDVYLQSVSQF